MIENCMCVNSVKEIYIYEDTIGEAVKHCMNYGNLEAIGLLMGRRYTYQGKEYIIVVDQIEAKSRSSHTFVELDREAYSHIGSVLRSEAHQKDFLIGWYHSHPNFGCWLSNTDIETQATYFYERYHCALVIDPIRRYLKFFKLREGNKDYRDVEFCTIFRDNRWMWKECYNEKKVFRF
jgi:proteasome lid subunit RPN8/RPN11